MAEECRCGEHTRNNAGVHVRVSGGISVRRSVPHDDVGLQPDPNLLKD